MPEDNQEMRSFYHFLGTGNKKEPSWFRPIQEEASLALVDWNNQDDSQSISGEEEASDLTDENMDIDDGVSDDEESYNDESDEEDVNDNTLANFKRSIFNLIYKIEDRFEKDRGNYEKAINAFIKQADKISRDPAVQKALHLFAKDVVSAVKKGRKKNAGNIPVRVGPIWVQPIPIQIYSPSQYFCRYPYISTNISVTDTDTDMIILADI